MCLYKFTHISLLKNDALLKQNKKSQKRATKLAQEIKKKKKKAQRIGQAHVQVNMDIFVIYLSNFSHSNFSLFWR